MGELWESSDFKRKLKRLPPEMQRQFLQHVREMYDKESNMMLDFLNESRSQMQDTAYEISSEQQALRETSDRMALSRLSTYDRVAVEDLLQRRGRHRKSSSRASSRTSSQMSTDSFASGPIGSPTVSYEVEEKLAVERYLRKRDRDKKGPGYPQRSTSTPPGPRDTPDSIISFEEEKEEIMRDMQGATTKIENERERQAEIVKRMKEKKKRKQQEKVVMANELLELANEMEQAVKKDKERQEEKLKQRLEEKKKKKGENGGDQNEGDDDEKKKKKKKDKERDEAGGEENGEEKKKKKKKKKDSEDGAEGADGAEGGDGEKKKKKKKKKDKDKEAPQESEA